MGEKLKRTKVKSSNIKSIGWEDEVLEIEFHNGGVYIYTGVPQDIHKILINAGSKGRAFFRYIRSNQDKYKYRKVE